MTINDLLDPSDYHWALMDGNEVIFDGTQKDVLMLYDMLQKGFPSNETKDHIRLSIEFEERIKMFNKKYKIVMIYEV